MRLIDALNKHDLGAEPSGCPGVAVRSSNEVIDTTHAWRRPPTSVIRAQMTSICSACEKQLTRHLYSTICFLPSHLEISLRDIIDSHERPKWLAATVQLPAESYRTIATLIPPALTSCKRPPAVSLHTQSASARSRHDARVYTQTHIPPRNISGSRSAQETRHQT